MTRRAAHTHTPLERERGRERESARERDRETTPRSRARVASGSRARALAAALLANAHARDAAQAWGEPGDALENARLDVLMLSSVNAVRPAALRSTWGYLTTHNTQPITFFLAGVRITQSTVIASVAWIAWSIGGAFIYVLAYGSYT